MTKKSPDWKKAQPHDATTGKIRSRRFTENNPKEVEWVKVKKTGK